MTVTRRAALALAALVPLSLAAAGSAAAQEKPRDKASVAVLRFVSSGGLFLAVEKGYFREAGIDVDLKFFEAAQPIAVAVVSGDADFGVTAFTGGFYNLAGKGALKVIAAQAKEAKGYEGNLVVASKAAYEAGLTGMEKLAGKSVGITQVGSSFHYQMGQIAAAKGFDLKSVQLKALQSLPNMMAAVKGGQVDAIIVAPHLAKSLIAAGDAKPIGRVSDGPSTSSAGCSRTRRPSRPGATSSSASSPPTSGARGTTRGASSRRTRPAPSRSARRPTGTRG
jgi:NitT/TauT family transport system substrate-binding protein